ncbi:MAG: FAD-dependent oxidoreductase [Aromatoleum sp.]|jgi:NADH dehydrogenase|uniref:NAD(P)/FAD-dependent oxidoreductase n=1 Tax=Aromatoleum sp. TaxID=2307007 RepID=UPI00289427D0|nr:FAD-dependent oxidoreductase [Aromatoleum sp.]MDT3671297.1 FAD-dependent oxidoreductase [Aromatoleum sp.]
MRKHILIAGAGFAGTWAAISAARAVSLAGKEAEVAITIVSPSANLVIRPRLYEAVIEDMNPDIKPLLDAVGVQHVAGTVTEIRPDEHQVTVAKADGNAAVMHYDKFVLAAGSQLFTPPIPGLTENSFNVDQLENARRLEAHVKSLSARTPTQARNTVVIAGSGLTGIETAAGMRGRLQAVLGDDVGIRVIIVEQAATIAPHLSAAARVVVEEALAECGVEFKVGAAVVSVDADGIELSSGERVESSTIVWTAGARAHVLAAQIPGEHDRLGRLVADACLRAQGTADIFVTGDVARAATDDHGNFALMSCQHAMSLGRVAGHNAAAELVGLPLHSYSQPKYVTCLDLGPWGALYTEGWDQQVSLVREDAKSLKREITTKWIYPPAADREAAFAVANPDFVIVP